MNDHEDSHHIHRGKWVFYGFAAIGGTLLLTEHRAHVLGVLPYLFLLACPLMHLFMHHGDGHVHDHHHDASQGEQK